MVIQIRDIHTHIHTVCIDAYSCIFYISIYLHIIRCIMCTYYIHIHYMDNKMCFSFGRCFAPRSSAAAADASRPAPSSAVAAPLAWALNGWCQRCVCIYIYRKGRCQVPIFPRFWKCNVFATSCSIIYVHIPVMVLLEIHTDCQTSPDTLAGWWYTYPSEKYESQLGLLLPIYGKIKNVPNHQPARYPKVTD